jgi:undecaprenyl-diphosphatase
LDLLQAVTLALIQGITEFLPISSSAHLILPSLILGWPDQGLAFDTSVHLGTLLAVIWYFRQDISRLARSIMDAIISGQSSTDSKHAVNLIIASLPILPVGFFLRFDIEQNLRSVDVIIATTLVFAVLLFVADQMSKSRIDDSADDSIDEKTLTWRQALLIGFTQCLALIPGTSRSGITMTTALLAGFSRESASRISFLISIPTIAGAATLKIADLSTSTAPVDWGILILCSTLAMISAYLCIKLFLDVIARIGFLPFVLYRLALGGLLLILVS